MLLTKIMLISQQMNLGSQGIREAYRLYGEQLKERVKLRDNNST
jgi:hypothetical protein